MFKKLEKIKDWNSFSSYECGRATVCWRNALYPMVLLSLKLPMNVVTKFKVSILTAIKEQMLSEILGFVINIIYK